MASALPIFQYTTTAEAVKVAEDWAKENDQHATIYKSPDVGWKVGRVQRGPVGCRFLNDDGAEVYDHNVIYFVYPCGSVYDRRMHVGIGPKFQNKEG